MDFDLLSTVKQSGCSIKLPPQQLAEILSKLPKPSHPNLLVGIDTCDDAGVYKISDEIALIQTTDFFTPVCSDAYEFGQIAAANSLSDVYAMGGKPITALNLVMFPDDKIPLEIYTQMLQGGNDKVEEAEAIIVGGHTISDYPPKYGLAVTGIVHPDRIITNANAKTGDVLILAKPLGTGVIIAGERLNEVSEKNYQDMLDMMKLLNKDASEIMQKYDVKAATDITGFSFIGHAKNIAEASNVTLSIESKKIPILEGAYELVDMGCIPGATFRNQKFLEKFCKFNNVDYNIKMLMFDAQTSGGILMCVDPLKVDSILSDLKNSSYPCAEIVGNVKSKTDFYIDIY